MGSISDIHCSPRLSGAYISGPSVWKLRLQFPFSATNFPWWCLHSGPRRQMTEVYFKSNKDFLNVFRTTDSLVWEKDSPSSEFYVPAWYPGIGQERSNGRTKKERQCFHYLWALILFFLVIRQKRKILLELCSWCALLTFRLLVSPGWAMSEEKYSACLVEL